MTTPIWLTRLYAALGRVTSTREFIPEIDGLRFLAIIPVVLLHCAATLAIQRGILERPDQWWRSNGLLIQLLLAGNIGVPIFFVISGFIVTLPFARATLQHAPEPSIRRYFLRRVTRIEPPYLIALTWMYLGANQPLAQNLPHYLAGLVYLHKVIFGTLNPIGNITWSLEVEVFFYLMAPWLCRPFYRIPHAVLRHTLQLAAVVGSSFLVHRILIPGGAPYLNHTIVTSIPFFLAGMLLADLYASGWFLRRLSLVWDLVGIAACLGLVYATAWQWYRLYWLTPVMIGAVFAAALEGRALNWFFRLRPITVIGGMCYTIYLWHTSVLYYVRVLFDPLIPTEWSFGAATGLFCLLALPPVLLLCAPIFYFIEKPFMSGAGSRFLERFFQPSPTPTAG